MLISFLNDVDVGCSLEFKNIFRKYDQTFSKILKGTIFRETLYYVYYI